MSIYRTPAFARFAAEARDEAVKTKGTVYIAIPEPLLDTFPQMLDERVEMIGGGAEVVKNGSKGKGPRLAIVAPGDYRKVRGRGPIFAWTRRFRPVDIEYACDMAFASFEEWDAAWLRALALGLCQADPGLAWKIAQKAPSSLEEVKEAVGAMELSASEARAVAAAAAFGVFVPEQDRLDEGKEFFRLWSAGLADADWLGRLAVHPSALAACGLDKEIERRVLSGCIAACFPMIDEGHALLCRRMAVRFGNGWHARDPEFENVIREIGAFPAYIRTYFPAEGKAGAMDMAPLADALRDLRNYVGHGVCPLPHEVIRSARLLHEAREWH